MATRKLMDCGSMPNDVGCTLKISGQEDEVIDAAVDHAVRVHGESDTPEFREELRSSLTDEVTAGSAE